MGKCGLWTSLFFITLSMVGQPVFGAHSKKYPIPPPPLPPPYFTSAQAQVHFPSLPLSKDSLFSLWVPSAFGATEEEKVWQHYVSTIQGWLQHDGVKNNTAITTEKQQLMRDIRTSPPDHQKVMGTYVDLMTRLYGAEHPLVKSAEKYQSSLAGSDGSAKLKGYSDLSLTYASTLKDSGLDVTSLNELSKNCLEMAEGKDVDKNRRQLLGHYSRFLTEFSDQLGAPNLEDSVEMATEDADDARRVLQHCLPPPPPCDDGRAAGAADCPLPPAAHRPGATSTLSLQKIALPEGIPMLDANHLPLGSCVATDVNPGSRLESFGISQVYHAAPGKSGTGEGCTLKTVGDSVENAMKLAGRNGIKKIYIPQIGGDIFLAAMKKNDPKLKGKNNIDAQKLLTARIVYSALSGLASAEDVKEVKILMKNEYVLAALSAIRSDSKEYPDGSSLLNKYHTRFSGLDAAEARAYNHNAGGGLGQFLSQDRSKNAGKKVALVNAANTEGEHGGGFSEAVAELDGGHKTGRNAQGKMIRYHPNDGVIAGYKAALWALQRARGGGAPVVIASPHVPSPLVPVHPAPAPAPKAAAAKAKPPAPGPVPFKPQGGVVPDGGDLTENKKSGTDIHTVETSHGKVTLYDTGTPSLKFYHSREHYYEFTNFFTGVRMQWNGVQTYSESAFQAMKFNPDRLGLKKGTADYVKYDQRMRAVLEMAPKAAMDAARAAGEPGSNYPLAAVTPSYDQFGWKTKKYKMMYDILTEKFNTAQMRELLEGTGTAEIIERTDYPEGTTIPPDIDWGRSRLTNQGTNNLGKILMIIRAEKRGEINQAEALRIVSSLTGPY